MNSFIERKPYYENDRRDPNYDFNRNNSSHDYDRKPSRFDYIKKKPRKVDHVCQVVHGRDQSESDSNYKVDKHRALDPYLRDQATGAYKRDDGMQFRLSQKSYSDESNNIRQKLQVSDDLTIQLNYNEK
jgi:hypothetical protein